MARPPNNNRGPYGPDPDDGSQENRAMDAAMRSAAQNIIGKALGGPSGASKNDPPEVPIWPVPGQPNADGVEPGKWLPDPHTGLPDGCPVIPMGYDDDLFYFFTARGTLSAISGRNNGKGVVQALFAGHRDFLPWAFPPIGNRKNLKNWDAAEAFAVLIDAAESKGPFVPMDQIRGAGAWLDVFGRIIWHGGDRLFTEDDAIPTGEHGNYLYPKRPRLPKPSQNQIAQSPSGGGAKLLKTFETWNWADSYSPAICLGWIGQAMIGGALRHRAHLLVSGKTGSGKSTFQGVIKGVMGSALLSTSDTTAAGIYQLVRYDTIPVAIDEFEASSDDRRNQAVIELARAATLGSTLNRGGDKGGGVSYKIRSAFLLTGIAPPGFGPQDERRFSRLQLKPLDKNSGVMPEQDLSVLAGWGREILRRMIDNFPRFNGASEVFREAFLKRTSMEPGNADHYATIMASYHIMMFDRDPSAQDIDEWVQVLGDKFDAQAGGRTDNWQDCLAHVLDAPVDMWRTESAVSIRILLFACFGEQSDDYNMSVKGVRKKLAELGCGIVGPKSGAVTLENGWLFIPNRHPGLSQLFRGTDWATSSTQTGKWHYLLEQAPASILEANKSAKISQAPRYGHKIKLSALFDPAEMPPPQATWLNNDSGGAADDGEGIPF